MSGAWKGRIEITDRRVVANVSAYCNGIELLRLHIIWNWSAETDGKNEGSYFSQPGTKRPEWELGSPLGQVLCAAMTARSKLISEENGTDGKN